MMNNDYMDKISYELPSCKDNTNMRPLGKLLSHFPYQIINQNSEILSNDSLEFDRI